MIARTGNVREVVLDIRGSGVQLEEDVGLTADAAWDMARDRKVSERRGRKDPSLVKRSSE